MNFIDKFFLWLFLKPTTIIRYAGIDLVQLKAILTAKLTMDNRRPAALSQMKQSREKKETKRATLFTMLGSLLMGLMMLFVFAVGNDLITKLTLFFTMFIFMLCITLITDFTSVLIDVRDNFIILPKPITDATFVSARLLHIAIRICIIVIPLSLPAFIAAIILDGARVAFPFVLMVALSVMLSIFFINAVYILILKITTPAKFQSIISYIQIGFAILIYAGYQLLPRLINITVLENISISSLPFIRFYPPFWFGESCYSLAYLNFSGAALVSVALSFALPFVSTWVVVRYFAPSFNRKLAMITASATEQSKPNSKSLHSKTSWIERIALQLTKPGSEYMGFLFTWKMMSRSRDFKMKVYPALGYVVVFFLMIFLSEHKRPFSEVFGTKPMLDVFLMTLYFSSFILITAIMHLPFSDKFKASWIFGISPIDFPGKVISGAIKSAIVCFYIPVVVFLFCFGLLVSGPSVLPNLILGCYNVLSISAIIAYITMRKLPFTASMEGSSRGTTVMRSMLTLIIPAIFGGVHWLVSGYLWMVVLLILITALIPWLVFDEIKKLNWDKISL
jgi:hypothetical protein